MFRFAVSLVAGLLLGASSTLGANEVVYLAGAAEVDGLAGARFSSVLTVSNPNAAAVSVRVEFLPQPGATVPDAFTKPLASGETWRVERVLATLFGLTSTAGALKVTSGASVVTTLATRNVADPRGTYGVALPPAPEASLLGTGDTGHGIWLSQSAVSTRGYRSNLAVVFTSPGEVELRVFDTVGVERGSRVLASETAAFVQFRLADVIGEIDFEGRYEVAVRSGRVLSYGVVNDNVTSDAIAVLADRAPPGGAQELLLAGAAKSPGLAGTFFSTDLRIFNPAGNNLAVVLSTPLAPGTTVTRSVPPRGLLLLDRILDLFGLPDGSAGPVRASASGPLLAAARTSNLDPTGERPGTFSAQQSVTPLPGGLVKAGDVAVFAGLEQSAGARTNLALVGGLDGGAGRLLLRDGEGTLLATTGFSRDPLSWGQASLPGWFPEAAVPLISRVDVVVEEGSLDGYVTVIDNGTGDPIAIPLRGLCAVEPFVVEPFGLAVPGPVTLRPVALRWDYRRGGAAGIAVPVSEQRLTVDGIETQLPPADRRRDLTFAAPGIHRVELVGREGCRSAAARLEFLVCDVLRLANPDLPEGAPATPYSAQLAFSGGVAPHRVALVAGALPEGLVLSPSGLLAGEPRAPGAFLFTVEITDALGCTGRVDLSLAVRGTTCAVLLISPTTVPVAVAGLAYAAVTFTAPAGAAPVSFSTAGPLPQGLTLSVAGVLSGTPVQTGSFPFIVRATDANGCTGSQSLAFTVSCPPLVVTPSSLSGAVVGQVFGPVSFAAQGAMGTTTFSTASRLPAGISLSSDGALSGTPTEVGVFPIEVAVRDANSCAGGVRVTLTVSCGTLQVLPATLVDGVAGQSYGPVTFSSPNGIGGVTFAATGTLPAGLSLSAAGVLSGTPTGVGSFPVSVRVTDANGCIGDATRTLRVVCGTFAVLPSSIPAGTANQVYGPVTFTAPAGFGTLAFRTTSPLPSGLSLSATGVFAGTPTQTGTFPILVEAVDGNGCPSSVSVSLVIACGSLTLAPQTLPSGVGGQAYAPVALSAAGGTAPIAFTATTTLPQGLLLSPQGVLSGTPAFAGTFPIGVLATDANGCTGTQTYSLVVGCGTLSVSPGSVPAAVAGQAYAAVTFAAAGATGTVSFQTASPVPAGMTLSAQGVLAGTPTQTGTYPLQIAAVDASGCRGTVTVSLVVACQALTVLPATLPPATANVVYGPVSFTSPEGLGTVVFSTTSILPAGVTLSAQGLLSGTPTQTGGFPIVVRATDGNACTGTVTTTLAVSCPTITVSPSSLPNGTSGQSYAPVSFVSVGGVGAVTFAVTGGLPAGMSLSPQGVLSGTPAQTGTFALSVTATDGNRCTGTVAARLTILCGSVGILPAALPAGRVGDAYTAAFSASGGVAPYVFGATGLPAGLVLTAAGALSGTPTADGVFTVTVSATDAAACAGSREYSVRICPVLSALPVVLPEATFGSAYSAVLTGAGGAAPYAFAVVGGALPAGISLAAGGTLSGTPGNTGSFGFTVAVTDANGCATSIARTLAVRPDARADSFGTAVGNALFGVGQPVSGAPGVSIAGSVLGNDAGAGTLTAGPPVIGTANGGSVSLLPDGTFVYMPAVGFTGPTDTFPYTLTDGNGTTASAVVTVAVENLVWFVDNAYAGGNGASDGRSHRPFTAMAAAELASAAGQTIFVHSGTGTTPGGITLKTGQTLWGQGAPFTLGALVISSGPSPRLGGTVVLASGVRVSSLDVVTAGVPAVSDPADPIVDVIVSNGIGVQTTGAPGVVLSDCAGSLTFLSITSSGGPHGLHLARTSGSFTVLGNAGPGSGGVLSQTGGDAVRLLEATSVTLRGLEIQDAGGDAVDVDASSGLVLEDLRVFRSREAGIRIRGGANATIRSTDLFASGFAGSGRALDVSGLTGNLVVLDSRLEGAPAGLARVAASTGALTINMDRISYRSGGPLSSDNAVEIVPDGTAAFLSEVCTSSFADLHGSAVVFGAEAPGSSGSSSLTATSNVVTGGGGGSFRVFSAFATTTLVNVSDNTFDGATGAGVLFVEASGSSFVSGSVSDNTVRDSGESAGIVARAFPGAGATLLMQGNLIANTGSDGLQAVNFGGSLSLAAIDNAVDAHNLSTAGFANAAGIAVYGFGGSTCLALGANAISGTLPAFVDYHVETQGMSSFTFEEIPDTAATFLSGPFLLSLNTGATVDILGSIPLSGGAACARP